METVNMDKDQINKKIKPYIENDSITYDVFLSLFNDLSSDDKDNVLRVIEEQLGIVVLEDFENNSNDSNLESPENESKVEEVQPSSEYEQNNRSLCWLIQNGDNDAKDELCRFNTGLVKMWARKYEGFGGNVVEFDDLVQVGYLGLIRAAEKFDLNKNKSRFSTYAALWLKQSMLNEINSKGHTIHIPTSVIYSMKKIEKLDSEYYVMGYSFSKRVELIAMDIDKTRAEVLDLMGFRYLMSVSSVDVPIGEDGSVTLLDFASDNLVESTDASSNEEEFNKTMEMAISSLSPLEQNVMRMKYGFKSGTPMSYEKVARELGLTIEHVKAIENKVLRRMGRWYKYRDPDNN